MSPRLSARQNKIRLIAVFLFTVLIVLVFQLYKGNILHEASSAVSASGELDESLFMGIRHASPAEVHKALPQAAGKPTLLSFSSRMCHDCQRMTPVLSQLKSEHKQIHFVKVDVLEDASKYPALFRAFKPVSVPTQVFIAPDGTIKNVLYNYQTPKTLAASLKKLQQQSTPPKAVKK